MIELPGTHDSFLNKIHLENNVQSVAQVRNIVLKTHFFILQIAPHLFHLKSEEQTPLPRLALIQAIALTFISMHR